MTLGLNYSFIVEKAVRFKSHAPDLNTPRNPTAVFIRFKDVWFRNMFKDRLRLLYNGEFGASKLRVFDYYPKHLLRQFRECQQISYDLRWNHGIRGIEIRRINDTLKVFFSKDGLFQEYKKVT